MEDKQTLGIKIKIPDEVIKEKGLTEEEVQEQLQKGKDAIMNLVNICKEITGEVD